MIVPIAGPTKWYHLRDTPAVDVARRLAELKEIHDATSLQAFTMRTGQALEIAVYRSLSNQSRLQFFGAFLDLEAHDDSTLYSKEEPPSALSGKLMPGATKFDFVVVHPAAGLAGVEVKNIREWMYPERSEVLELLRKSIQVEAVPVLIARRIAYNTFSVLNPCGVVLHQVFNQRYPNADHALAEKAKHKDLLGYHDVRVGNEPDTRLNTFLHEHLPALLPDARARFQEHLDLLTEYAAGPMSYEEFAARVKRRQRGEPEDGDPPRRWRDDYRPW